MTIKLINLLKDPNEWVREAAADELSKHQKEIVRIKLIEILKNDKHRNSRKYAAEVLGEFDNPKVIDALEDALEDKSSSVRKSALRALEKFNHPKVEKILDSATDSEYEYVEKEARGILKRKKLDKKFDEKSNNNKIDYTGDGGIEPDCNKKNSQTLREHEANTIPNNRKGKDMKYSNIQSGKKSSQINLKCNIIKRRVDSNAFFSIQSESGNYDIALNTQHEIYDNLLTISDGLEMDDPEEYDKIELINKMKKANYLLKILLGSWARMENEAPHGEKIRFKETRRLWGKILKDIL